MHQAGPVLGLKDTYETRRIEPLPSQNSFQRGRVTLTSAVKCDVSGYDSALPMQRAWFDPWSGN